MNRGLINFRATIKLRCTTVELLAVYRKATIRIDLSITGKESNVDRALDMAQGKLKGLLVMIHALFAGVDQFRHHSADHRGVLILIAAGTDGHIETLHIGFVVDRDPVI